MCPWCLQAAEAYSKALECRTSSHILWANRAAALLRLQRPGEALEDARRARTLEPAFVKVGITMLDVTMWGLQLVLRPVSACLMQPILRGLIARRHLFWPPSARPHSLQLMRSSTSISWSWRLPSKT